MGGLWARVAVRLVGYQLKLRKQQVGTPAGPPGRSAPPASTEGKALSPTARARTFLHISRRRHP